MIPAGSKNVFKRIIPVNQKSFWLFVFVVSATCLIATPSAVADTPDADRTFLHPSEDNQTKNLTLTSGTYTFRTDAEPDGYHWVEWYDTYSGGSPVVTAHLYFYDDTNFTLTTTGWVRAEIYKSNIWGDWLGWEAAYRWYVTVPETITVPTTPTGPSSGLTGQNLAFSTGGSTSNKGHSVQYRFDWGDGSISAWGSSTQSHSYSNPSYPDAYNVKAQARCSIDTSVTSSWSGSLPVTIDRPKSGQILSADPDTFTGSAKTVTVTVKNTGKDNANLIVECDSYPSGWSVSPGSKQTIVPYNTTNSTYFSFTVTPPSSDSSGTIVWKLYYDDTWPTPNTLLDTYNQAVTNTVPETITTPSTPSGPSSGLTEQSLSFTTGGSTSNKGHSVQYRFDWGDGSISAWGSSTQSHSYSNPNTYNVKAQARCSADTSVTSLWSGSLSVTIDRPKSGQILSADPDTFTGSAKTVTVTVKNTGKDSANLIVECDSYPSGWSVSPGSEQTIVPYNTTNSTYFTFTVTPPSSDSSGTIVWKLYYDDTWPTPNTLLDTYNQAVSNVQPKPDLIVESIWTEPASPIEGQSYKIKATVKNQGNAPANPTGLDQWINAHFYIGSTDAGGEQEWCTSIAVGGTYTFSSASRTAPAAGPYTIKAVADSQGDVAESNEGNNEKTAPITVQPVPKPDLIVESVWTEPASPIEGQNYKIKATVRNQGNADANPTGLDQWINAHFYIGSTDAGGEQEWCTSIAVGGTYTFSSASRTAPVHGNYTIKAVADSQADVAESDESNNEKTANITVQARSTPVILSVSYDSNAIYQNDWFDIDIAVKNTGALTPEGGISLAIPSFNSPSDIDRIYDDGSSFDTSEFYIEKPAGSTIWHKNGTQIIAGYLLAEFVDNNWQTDEINYLKLKVKPNTGGNFTFYVRSAMDAGNSLWINAPQSSSSTDQQGWPVQAYTVYVKPYTSIDSEPTGAKLYVNGNIVATTPYGAYWFKAGDEIKLKKFGHEDFVHILSASEIGQSLKYALIPFTYPVVAKLKLKDGIVYDLHAVAKAGHNLSGWPPQSPAQRPEDLNNIGSLYLTYAGQTNIIPREEALTSQIPAEIATFITDVSYWSYAFRKYEKDGAVIYTAPYYRWMLMEMVFQNHSRSDRADYYYRYMLDALAMKDSPIDHAYVELSKESHSFVAPALNAIDKGTLGEVLRTLKKAYDLGDEVWDGARDIGVFDGIADSDIKQLLSSMNLSKDKEICFLDALRVLKKFKNRHNAAFQKIESAQKYIGLIEFASENTYGLYEDAMTEVFLRSFLNTSDDAKQRLQILRASYQCAITNYEPKLDPAIGDALTRLENDANQQLGVVEAHLQSFLSNVTFVNAAAFLQDLEDATDGGVHKIIGKAAVTALSVINKNEASGLKQVYESQAGEKAIAAADAIITFIRCLDERLNYQREISAIISLQEITRRYKFEVLDETIKEDSQDVISSSDYAQFDCGQDLELYFSLRLCDRILAYYEPDEGTEMAEKWTSLVVGLVQSPKSAGWTAVGPVIDAGDSMITYLNNFLFSEDIAWFKDERRDIWDELTKRFATRNQASEWIEALYQPPDIPTLSNVVSSTSTTLQICQIPDQQIIVGEELLIPILVKGLKNNDTVNISYSGLVTGTGTAIHYVGQAADVGVNSITINATSLNSGVATATFRIEVLGGTPSLKVVGDDIVDFGAMNIGESRVLDAFTVTNTGQGVLFVTANVNSPFTVISDGVSLTANQSAVFKIKFQPRQAGSFSEEVQINSTAGTIQQTVRGNCVVTLPPLPPASINYPVVSSTGQYTVSWSSSSAATSYQLERSDDDENSWSQIYSDSNTSYQENIGNGSYLYSVKATNDAGSSDWTTGAWDCVVNLPSDVPNVVGMTQSIAETTITGAALTIGTVTQQYDNAVSIGLVISQNPAGGTSVSPGSSVDLVVSLGKPVVPNVVGMTQSAATAAITAVDSLTFGTVTQQYSDTMVAGLVISQNPVGGSAVNIGSSVNLVISLGKPVVPNVVGMTQSAATSAITSVDTLTVGTVTQQYSDTVAVGLVISQNPVGGTAVNIGSSVSLVISLGKPGPPILSISAVDNQAAETVSGAPANTGTFRISRVGSTTSPLTVYFSRTGTATFGAAGD